MHLSQTWNGTKYEFNKDKCCFVNGNTLESLQQKNDKYFSYHLYVSGTSFFFFFQSYKKGIWLDVGEITDTSFLEFKGFI